MKKIFAFTLIIFSLVSCLASCDQGTPEKEHEHTYEWVTSKETHFKQYTCGCASPDVAEVHLDEDGDLYCDVCNYYTSKQEHIGHTYKWITTEETHFKQYTCGCSSPDVAEAHLDEDGDLFCDVCNYAYSFCGLPEVYYLSTYENWIETLTAENVAKVRTISEYVGVAPGSLKTIESSTDKGAISRIIEEYMKLEMSPIAPEEALVDGGSAFTIEFILNDGTVRSLYFNNGNYSNNWQYFELLSVPTFKEDDKTWTSCGFVSYSGVGTVCSYVPEMSFYNPTPICQIPLDELEFQYDVDVDLAEIKPYNLLVQTDFGDLTFITPDIFYIDGGRGICCVLVGKDLDELISEYSESNDEYYCTVLIEAFWKKNPDAEFVSIRNCYGKFESGAIVAMIDSGAYDEAEWQEIIDDVVIQYTNGNRIIVLYNNEFYTLTEAYDQGYITADELNVIADLHNYEDIDDDTSTFENIGDIERCVSEQWTLMKNFKIIEITVDTVDSPEHEPNWLGIKYSYTVDGDVETNFIGYDFSYDEFLMLYDDNNDFLVYSLTDGIVDSIESDSLAVIWGAIEWYFSAIEW
ncbi:MAG: hypothetical protein IKJ07_04110 [Clostridia bacterium]|nr:hypothetical protein [Clostridia bacterium]